MLPDLILVATVAIAAPRLGLVGAGDAISGATLSADGTSAFLCAQTSLKANDRLYRLSLPTAAAAATDATAEMEVAAELVLPMDPTAGDPSGAGGWKQINCGTRLATTDTHVYIPMTEYASSGGVPALLRAPLDFASSNDTAAIERLNLDIFPGSTLQPPNRWPWGNPVDIVVTDGSGTAPAAAIVALANGTLLQIPTDSFEIGAAIALSTAVPGCEREGFLPAISGMVAHGDTLFATVSCGEGGGQGAVFTVTLATFQLGQVVPFPEGIAAAAASPSMLLLTGSTEDGTPSIWALGSQECTVQGMCLPAGECRTSCVIAAELTLDDDSGAASWSGKTELLQQGDGTQPSDFWAWGAPAPASGVPLTSVGKVGVLVSGVQRAGYDSARGPVPPNGTMLAMFASDSDSDASTLRLVDFAALTAQAGEAGVGRAYHLLSTATSGAVLAIAKRGPQFNKPELAVLLGVAAAGAAGAAGAGDGR
jgi:hypothetical protein